MMRSQTLFSAVALLSLAGPGFASETQSEEPKTAEQVIAVDKAWGDAEESGNLAFVERLLDPGYRSISADGKTTDRAAILSHVSATHDAAREARIAEYKASHPSTPSVSINGDAAILTWVSSKAGSLVYSCDIFTYSHGHWHAVYSQHTTA